MSTIPGVLINAKVYDEGKELLGAGNVQLPDFEVMTDSLSGLGIAGEVDLPVIGHFKSMAMSITWTSVCKDALAMLAPRAHALAIYASVQNWDAVSGTFAPTPVRVQVRATPKKTGVGKLEPGKKTEPTTDFELTYIKVSLGGQELVEIDKINFLCVVDGVDQLAEVRAHLGM